MQVGAGIRQTLVIPALQRHARALARSLLLQDARAICRHALLPYLGTRLLVVLAALLANFYILGTEKPHVGKPRLADATHFPDLLWTNWVHFDSGFYLHLSIAGYPPHPPDAPNSIWEFYPLYPAIIHPLALALGGSYTAFCIAGLLIANLAALLAIGFLFVLVRRDFGERVAGRTVIFQALFPSSFFLSAVYSESVFLAPAIACLYYTRTHRWLLAGIFGALATLARGPGLLLLLPVAWEFWQAVGDDYAPLPPPLTGTRRERLQDWLASRLHGPRLAAHERDAWLALLAVLLIPLAQVAFMVYARVRAGTFFANLTAVHTWYHRFSWPWDPVLHDLILHPPSAPSPWIYNLYGMSLALLIIFTACTIWAFFRLPTIYALYSLVMLLVPLSSGYITSLPRYYLVIFPAFILLALRSDPATHPQRYSLLIALFAVLLAMLTTFFELGYPISGA